jgi:hypothetical protein
VADGPQKTIDRLLTAPADYVDFERTMASLTSREANAPESAQLALYRMINTPFPLHERSVRVGSQAEAIALWLLGSERLSLPAAPDTGKLISTILRSNVFFSPAAYRRRVKSPLEFALNLAIPLEVELAPVQLHAQLASLGQGIGPERVQPDPPRRWLNRFTMIGRSKLAAAILTKGAHFPDRRTLIDTLVQADVPASVLKGLETLDGRELAQAIADLPEFQLA